MVVDLTRNKMKLLPGTHALPSDLQFTLGFALAIHGEATIAGSMYFQAGMTASGLRLKNLRVTETLGCDSSSVVPVPHMVLENVSCGPATQGYGLNLARCIGEVRQSHLRGGTQGGALRVSGSGGTDGQLVVVDGSTLESTVAANPVLYVSDTAALRMTNSIVLGGSPVDGSLRFGTSVGLSSIAFSTFYNTFLKCPTGNLIVDSRNNVFLNEATGAPADTVTGSACVHSYVLTKPQSATPTGANNLVNVDPRFVNAASNDFHLVAGSPAIDAAEPTATEATDYDGTARPQA
jgi:hypothetical protein